MQITLGLLIEAFTLDAATAWQTFWMWRAWANLDNRPPHAEPKGIELCAAAMLACKLRASVFPDVRDKPLKQFKRDDLYAAEKRVFAALISQGATETPWDRALELARWYVRDDALQSTISAELDYCAYSALVDPQLRLCISEIGVEAFSLALVAAAIACADAPAPSTLVLDAASLGFARKLLPRVESRAPGAAARFEAAFASPFRAGAASQNESSEVF